MAELDWRQVRGAIRHPSSLRPRLAPNRHHCFPPWYPFWPGPSPPFHSFSANSALPPPLRRQRHGTPTRNSRSTSWHGPSFICSNSPLRHPTTPLGSFPTLSYSTTVFTTTLRTLLLSLSSCSPPTFTLPRRALSILTFAGLALIAIGQLLRSMAMIHAHNNFSHIVADKKRTDHELVTTGVYAWTRHPSYVGFFYWCGNAGDVGK